MKTPLLILFFLIIKLNASAQYVHSANDKMNSFEWDVISWIRFEKLNDTLLVPIYDEAVKRFENRSFVLTGYMIPTKAGMKQAQFFISSLPVMQCSFCGKNGNPIMVVVNVKTPVTFTFKPVTVTGKLKLDKKNGYYMPPVHLDDAELADAKH